MSGEQPAARLRPLRVVRGPLRSGDAAGSGTGPQAGPAQGAPGDTRAVLRTSGLDPAKVASTVGELVSRLSDALAELRDVGMCRPPLTEDLRDELTAILPAGGATAAAAREALQAMDTVAFDTPVEVATARFARALRSASSARDELLPLPRGSAEERGA